MQPQSQQKQISRLMTDAEFRASCHKFNLTVPQVTEIIYMKTGAVIASRAIYSILDRDGKFGDRYTAIMRFLFKQMEADLG